MRGLPRVCKTRSDWEKAVAYASSPRQRAEMARRLEALKDSGTVLVLKAGAPAVAEEQRPEHFEETYDPRSSLAISGFTAEEIDQMIARLGGV